MNTSKIYVDLDSLLDTRQGILSNFYNAKELSDLVSSREYNFRKIDIFNVDMNKYNAIKEQKLLETLTKSTLTYIINTVKQKLINLEKKNISLSEFKEQEILINVDSYKVTESICNLIQEAVFRKLEIPVYITIIDRTYKDLSPRFIKDQDIRYMFIYDIRNWVNYHLISLENIPLKDTTFFMPALLNKLPTDEEFEKFRKTGYNDPFSLLQLIVSQKTTFDFLPVTFYSNIVTASSYVDLFMELNKNYSLSDELAKEKGVSSNGDSSTKV